MDPRVWFLILLYFMVAFSSNAGGLYLPELIRNRFPDSNKVEVGLLAAAPSACGLVAMLVNGAWSDRTGKHRLHVAIPALLSSLGWVLAALSDSPGGSLLGLCLARMGLQSRLGPFR